jgi:hypothetical protein
VIRNSDSLRFNFSSLLKRITAMNVMRIVIGVKIHMVLSVTINPEITDPIPVANNISLTQLPKRFPTDRDISPFRKALNETINSGIPVQNPTKMKPITDCSTFKNIANSKPPFTTASDPRAIATMPKRSRSKSR